MQLILSNADYSFAASAKGITLAAPFDVLTAEQILHITNLTTRSVIYDSERRTHPISVTTGVITHTYDSVGMADSDVLQISVDDGTNSAGTAVLNNFSATTAPTVNDDSDDGYAVGSRWIDTATGKSYTCVDATVGAAVWTDTTSASADMFIVSGTPGAGVGELGDIAFDEDTGDVWRKDEVYGTPLSDTFYPTSNSDDGHWTSYGVVDTYNWMTFGLSGTNLVHHAYCAFDSIGIPNAAQIVSAYVKFKAAASNSATTCNLNVYFNDEDSPVIPTTASGADALSLTSVVAWGNVPAWTLNSFYDTPDLTTALQQVVDRSGWVSGNDAMVLIKDNSSSLSTARTVTSYNAPGSDYPALHVTWRNPTGVATWVKKYATILSNLSATVDPTVNEDSGDGYSIGSRWENTTDDREFVCLDATAAAAVWLRTTGSVITEKTPVNAVASQGMITVMPGGPPVIDDNIVIDTQTFLFKAARTGAGEITVSSNDTTQRNNIRSAINADMTQVVATDGVGDSVVVTAATKGIAANSYVFTTDAAPIIILNGAGTLGGTTVGVNGTVGEENELCADATHIFQAIEENTIADANWRKIALSSLSDTAWLRNVVEDTTPQLGGVLDTNSHQVNWSKGADVASAGALTLGADGNYFDVTGTTTITSIVTRGIGTVVVLHFDGILTLTHNATDLILFGAGNITTAAGDEAMFVEYASGDWRCVVYTKADGTAVVGGILTNVVIIKGIADDTTLVVGDGKTHFTVPIEFDGMDLVSIGAHVYTVSSSGVPTFQIHNLTDSVDMLSTEITIDVSENDSKDAATAAVIDTTKDDVVTGDVLRFDCDVAGTGTKGMEIRMGFRKP